MQGQQLCASPAQTGRLNQLQFLRFIAFLNIFVFHEETWNFIGYPTWNGALSSVSFFFILSGALSGYSGYGKTQPPTVKRIAAHMWKKIKGIYPLYFFVTIVGTLNHPLLKSILHHRFDRTIVHLPQLIKNLLMVQSWFPTGYFNFAGVGWFFSSIMFLYLFTLPAVYLLNKMNSSSKRRWLLGGSMAAILLATVTYQFLTAPSADIHFVQYIFPPARLGEYLAGMILGFALRGRTLQQVDKPHSTALFTMLEVLALAGWFTTLFLPGGNWAERVIYWLIPNMLLITVFTCGHGLISRLFSWKPLVRLGDVSGDCILLHVMFIYMYHYFTGYWESNTKLQQVVPLALTLGLTVLMAFMINRKRK